MKKVEEEKSSTFLKLLFGITIVLLIIIIVVVLTYNYYPEPTPVLAGVGTAAPISASPSAVLTLPPNPDSGIMGPQTPNTGSVPVEITGAPVSAPVPAPISAPVASPAPAPIVAPKLAPFSSNKSGVLINGPEYLQIQNTDRTGCQEACLADPKCSAWSFGSPPVPKLPFGGGFSLPKICLLKNKTESETSVSSFESGYITRP